MDQTIFTSQNLYRAYNDCLKRKKKTANALKFELNREVNLFNLLNDLKNHKYRISRHICFILLKPRPREIFAADFRDRIVHHLIYNEIKEIFEIDFLDCSYSNRQNKGPHEAVFDVTKNIRWQGMVEQKEFYLKADIKNFFRSVDKKILWKLVYEKITASEKPVWWKHEILSLLKMNIFHDPTTNYIFKGSRQNKKLIPKHKSLFYGSSNTGLPIGNLTSQFFANVYLNELDYFIKHNLKCPKYYRYVDDFIIINYSSSQLSDFLFQTNSFLHKNLNLEIHPKKIVIQPKRAGVDFLGYFIKPEYSLVRNSVVDRFRQTRHPQRFNNNKQYRMSCTASYFGQFEKVSSYNLRQYFTDSPQQLS